MILFRVSQGTRRGVNRQCCTSALMKKALGLRLTLQWHIKIHSPHACRRPDTLGLSAASGTDTRLDSEGQ